MLEVEVKYRVGEWEQVRCRLTECGATRVECRKDTDHYFNAPDRDFKTTDEALRLRRIGSANKITYKGPRFKEVTKTRTEVELDLGPGAQTATNAVVLLTHLGYRPAAVVTKTREVFRMIEDGIELAICLDDVGAVGKFVEIETMTEEDQLPSAQAAVLALAAKLGLTENERRSYLEMLLAQSAR